LPGRILNIGDIHIVSTDRSAPPLVLHGVDEPKELYETLRERVARSQAARRTI